MIGAGRRLTLNVTSSPIPDLGSGEPEHDMPTKHPTKPMRSTAIKQADRPQPTRSAAAPFNPHWRRRLKELAAFKKKYGHCCVSTLGSHASLGNWVRTQRGRRRRGQLSQEQIRILDELGFCWGVRRKAFQPKARMTEAEINQATWESMYEVLVAYQQAHGHCRVPLSTRDHSSLTRWLIGQRSARRKGKLSAERVRRLDELGFSWDVQAELERLNRERWESMYKNLVAYRRAHGHCRVSVSPKEWSSLGMWVGRQRVARREGKLSAERVLRLEKLGFVWELWEERWEKMFTALAKYKKAHGNCDVPGSWPENPELSSWVVMQRTINRKGILRPERKERLEALGFRWSPHGTGSTSKFTKGCLAAVRADRGDETKACRWGRNPAKMTKVSRPARRRKKLH